jgi:hypothetical protein
MDKLAQAYKTVRDATIENEDISRAEAISILTVILHEQVKEFENTLVQELKRT